MSVRMMYEYAKKELARIEHDEEGMQDMVDNCVLDIIEIFSEQGHSAYSASYVTNILERLMRFLPLTPLTGEADEWIEIAPEKYQNRRCSRVFKENGQAYNIDGKAFSEDGGKTWFTNRDSFVPISFPYYVPTKPEFVYLERERKMTITREEAKDYWMAKYEAASEWDDPHWEASERKEHRQYVDALRTAIEALSDPKWNESVKAEICDDICRYPHQFNEDEQAELDAICAKCPLERV